MSGELQNKIETAKKIIKKASKKYKKIATACSFGKDSITTLDIAKQTNPEIETFSIMTPHLPQASYKYAKKITKDLDLNTKVYMVADEAPEPLKHPKIEINLLDTTKYKNKSKKSKKQNNQPLYKSNPDECCKLLKVKPINYAINDLDLDAWLSGLRNTESATREQNKPFEKRENSVKVNPILEFTEKNIFNYLNKRDIEIHPWYKKKINGKRYRSLGCNPCTEPVKETENERKGRWSWTDKTECGIHKENAKKQTH